MIEIPLTSDGEQKLSIALNETLYSLRVIYNTRLNLWSLTITTSGVDLATVALVVGGDILNQYNIGLRNLFVVNTTGSNIDADAENLGTDIKLYHLTDEEVLSVSTV